MRVAKLVVFGGGPILSSLPWWERDRERGTEIASYLMANGFPGDPVAPFNRNGAKE